MSNYNNTEMQPFYGKRFHAPIIFLVFAIICFMTSFYFDRETRTIYKGAISQSGGVVGPFKVTESNSVLTISINQWLSGKQANSITIKVLDEEKKRLFSSNKELWSDYGYDSEGSWSEKDNKVELKATFKKIGRYYLSVESETSQGYLAPLNVIIKKRGGSSIPHMVTGIIALIIALGLYYLKANENESKGRRHE